MGKASVILEEKESLVDVFRYFEYEGGKYVIFGEGHNGDDEYTTLHFSKINEEGVAVKIEDEEEWNKLKGMIKVIVKEAKAGEVTSISDKDELELKNVKVDGSKVFKLNSQVAYVLASNKNYTRFSDFEGEESDSEESENNEEVKQEETQEDVATDSNQDEPKSEDADEAMPSFGLPNDDESNAMPSFELPKDDNVEDEATDMTKEYEISNEKEQEGQEESTDIEKQELTSFELPEEEKNEEEVEEQQEESTEEEAPVEEDSDEEDPYTQSINNKIHTLEELLGEQIVEKKEEPVEEEIEEEKEENEEPKQEEQEEAEVEKPVDDEKDKVIEELKAKVEEHERIINKLREVLK